MRSAAFLGQLTKRRKSYAKPRPAFAAVLIAERLFLINGALGHSMRFATGDQLAVNGERCGTGDKQCQHNTDAEQ